MIYTQRHQIVDALGHTSQDRIQAMIDDCRAGEIERAVQNEEVFDAAAFDRWLSGLYNAQVDKQLDEINRQSIRAIRAERIAAADSVAPRQADIDRLKDLELRAEVFRYQRPAGARWVDYPDGAELPKNLTLLHDGQLYKVNQTHDKMSHYPPGTGTDALYSTTHAGDEIHEWEQKQGSHDAYKAGDKVFFNAHIYEAKFDGTTHSPAQAPGSWIDHGPA